MQAVNVQHALAQAIRCHQQRRFDDARRLYTDVIRQQPAHFDALHLLGVLHVDQRDYGTGANLIQTALAINPRFAKAHFNLGLAYAYLDRHDSASTCFGNAIALKPDYAEAYNSRGTSLASLKRFEAALRDYDSALALRADYPQALCNRAVVLASLARHQEALDGFDQLLRLKPDNVEALRHRAAAYLATGRFADALVDCEQALQLQPDSMDVLCLRASVLAATGQLDEALALYDRVIECNPDDTTALAGCGVVLAALGRLDDALASYDRALRADPRHADALHNRGFTLFELRRYAEAVRSFEAALASEPGHVKAFNNMGLAFAALRMFEPAIECFDRSLAKTESVSALFNKAEALLKVRKFDESVSCLERASALDLAAARRAAGSLFFLRQSICDWSDREQAVQRIREYNADPQCVMPPFILFCMDSSGAERLLAARKYAASQAGAVVALDTVPTAAVDRIRVAYLSANFNAHPVAHCIVDLFERHDRSRFEIIAVSFGVDDGSEIRRRIVASCDRFVDVYEQSDVEIARMLRDLNVTIVVDLMGHTEDARLGVLAHRPAPIQVNYLGYPGTTGFPHHDYILADSFIVPPEHLADYDEKVISLQGCYLPSDPRMQITDRIPGRGEEGLPEDGFVFCCFNAHYKITPAIFDVWMQLLREVPESVLWLSGNNAIAERNLRREAQSRGVDPTRLVFARRTANLADHLARHRLAGLFLDTAPYNAHSTARDALWAGLPLVTCAGQTFASRVAGSVLLAAGLPELITTNLQEYAAVALRYARDTNLRQSTQAKLDATRSNSLLFDAAAFCRNVEAAYQAMVTNVLDDHHAKKV